MGSDDYILGPLGDKIEVNTDGSIKIDTNVPQLTAEEILKIREIIKRGGY